MSLIPAAVARLDRARANGAYTVVDRTESWMLAFAVAFLVVLIWPLIDRDMSPALANALHGADIVIWLVFVVEYMIRLTLVQERWRFVRTHIPDLIVVLVPPLRASAFSSRCGCCDSSAWSASPAGCRDKASRCAPVPTPRCSRSGFCSPGP